MKLLCFLFFSMLCAFSVPAVAQFNSLTVDPGPYTPGSTISATFTLNPSTCIIPGNVFELYLSNATGSFANEVRIGTYNSFYSTFVNGIIPTNTPAGSGYKIRVKSSSPILISAESAAFEIKLGASVIANIESNKNLPNTLEAFGFCNAQIGPAANIILGNKSTLTAIVNATFNNELSNTKTNSPILTNITFRPDKAHYTMFVKAVMPDGTVGTKAYFIINNEAVTAFTTSGNNFVCLPGGALTYSIATTGNGIQLNFPGNTYKINWGDQTENIYTFCDLKGGSVSHNYATTSCGQTFTSGNTTIYNAFGINVQVVSPFCGNVGTGISTTAKVVTITQNRFQGPTQGCTAPEMEFENTSILGDDPNNTGPSCKSDEALFTWYVDGVAVEFNKLKSFVFKILLSPGKHIIRLESTSPTGCSSIGFEKEVCIQKPAIPSFDLPTPTSCISAGVTPINTSEVDLFCNNTITYIWTVTPNNGVNPSTYNLSSPTPPTFNFTQPGIYTISLSIATLNCATSAAFTRKVTVNKLRSVDLSPSITLCNYGTFNFSPNAGPTKTVYDGTEVVLDDVFSWNVTSNNGGTFEFITAATSKYPTIKFNSFDTYTITSTVTNVCGTSSDVQVITFTPAPIVNAGADVSICYNTPNVILNGSLTGANVISRSWVGGNGVFTPTRNDLNATYQPTVGERDAGRVTLTLKAITSLPSPCQSIEDEIIITIKPNIIVNSNAAKSICNSTAVNYTPTSATAGATFAWTATGSANATGFSQTGTGNINDAITNTSATTNAIVVYTITPSFNGCSGVPFTFTVTITPNPIAIATTSATNATICSGQNTSITLTANLTNTKYTWTSTKTAGITGNSANATPTLTTTINDVLINSGTVTGTATYTITPISANGCSGSPITITITVEPTPTLPIAGVSKSICNQNTYTLQGNTVIVGTGKWTQVTTFSGVTFDDNTKPNAIVSGLQLGNTYTFRWTITGAASCTPKHDDVSITVSPSSVGGRVDGSNTFCAGDNSGQITLIGQTGNVIRWESSLDGGVTYPTVINNTTTTLIYTNLTATTYFRAIVLSGVCASAISSPAIITVNRNAIISNAGADQNLCNTSTATLNGNSPTPDTGLWTLMSGQTGISFGDATKFNTTVNGLVGGQIYTFRWTISSLAPCPASSDDVTIKIDFPSNGGITTGSTTVCAGNSNAQINVSGQVGNILRWESSTDNFATITLLNTTSSSITYTNLTATTKYRAVVKNGVCAEATSTVATITVNQGAVISMAGQDQTLCNVTSTVLAGNSAETNTGIWTLTSGQAGVIFVNATQFNTTVNGLVEGQVYTFRWTISGLAPCPASSDDVTIKIDSTSNGGITTGSTTVCAGNSNAQITLSGQVGNILRWESSTDNFSTLTIINTSSPSITYTNLTATTKYRAVVKNGVCAEATSTVATVTVNQGAVISMAGQDQDLCNATSTILAGNTTGVNTGLWTLISGQTGVTFVNASQFNTTVNGLVGGQVYTFRWTISGLAPCPASSDDIVVNNLSPLLNNNIATPETTNCDSQAITLTGSLPTGGNGIYTYIWQSSATGVAPFVTIAGQTSKDLNIIVSSNLSYQRIAYSGVCVSISNILSITALPKIANNSITANQTICLTTTPNPITGSQPTGGDGKNYIFSWEQSTDNGITWFSIPGIVTPTLSPPAITQTTSYRRLVASSACSGSLKSVSNAIKIIVNLNAKAEFTYTNDVGCIPFIIDASQIKAVPYPTRNATYTWYANDVLIGTGIIFPGFTISTNNTNVVIKLVTTSSLGCIVDEMSHTFKTRQSLIAAFTQSNRSGCGPLTVTFTNTTSLLTDVNFEWTVDNTVISNAVTPGNVVFEADPAGKDKIYNVSVKATTACGSTTYSSTVTVRPKPIAAFLPSITFGCSPLTVKFTNTSPSSLTTTYSYDFDEGTISPTTTSKSAISHTFITTVVKDYTVKMTATNECGTTTKSVIIRVSPNTITPALIVNGNQMRGCAPFTVDFINNTEGASRFTYTFEPGNVVTSNTFLPEIKSHTFTKAGTYVVNLLAENECSTASTQVTIVVNPQPIISFKADITTGCIGLKVKFSKTSTNAVSYLWDFGDGTTSTAEEPTHNYNGPAAQYNVTLTATNILGCSTVATLQNYITTVKSAKADFSISPAAVISIPAYTFKFTDESTNGAETYKWSFGDGDISSLKDPTHKYADTGKYLVTLRTYNKYGCVDSISKNVQIVGIPSYMYLPNSFIPGGTSAPLQTFIAIGSGIKSWKMQVFNKWGQVIWETTKLDDGKPIDGWDGNYKGVPQPQGIYFWKIDLELVNGTEWKGMTYDKSAPKRTGEIYLIR